MTPSDQLQVRACSRAADGELAEEHRRLPEGRLPAWAQASIGAPGQASWSELNDRFYRELEFGTGGIRGRTIGAVATAAETGASPGQYGVPEHAAVGSNMLNDFTLARAVIGLFHYTRST
jgi:phosphoglucomutase